MNQQCHWNLIIQYVTKSKIARSICTPLKKLHTLIFIGCSTLLISPLALAAENISGTYVSNYSNAAIMLQVVQLSGGQVQGRMDEVVLASSGQQLNETSFSVTGAVSGETIVLSLRKTGVPQVFAKVTSMSGVLKDGRMQLSEGHTNKQGILTVTLNKSNPSFFNRQVATLSDAANAGASAAATEKRLQEQRKDAERRLHVETESRKVFDNYCPYTAKIESRLKGVREAFIKTTKVMEEKLQEQKVTPPNSVHNGFERNQILYSINDDWYDSNDIEYSLNDLSSDANYTKGTIHIKSVPGLDYAMKQDALHGCGNGGVGFCAQVNTAFNRADQCNTDLIAAFQKTYVVQDQERAKQEVIKQEAARLANAE